MLGSRALFKKMKTVVLATGQQLQVLDAVVFAITVDVMDVMASRDRASLAFPDKPVLVRVAPTWQTDN